MAQRTPDLEKLFECFLGWRRRKRKKEIHVAEGGRWTQAKDFLLSEGVVRSMAMARAVFQEWQREGFFDAGFAARLRNDVAQGDRGGAVLKSECDRFRRVLREDFPGLHVALPAEPLVYNGAEGFRLQFSGMWVSRKTGRASRRVRMSYHRGKAAKATVFRAVPFRAQSGPVRYGDCLWLYYDNSERWPIQIMCPGKTGIVHVGDHVYLVTLALTRRIGPLGVCGRSFAPPESFFVEEDHMVFSIVANARESQDAIPRPRPQPSSSESFDINVLVYNVWMLGWPVTFWAQPLHGTSPKKLTRAKGIPKTLQSVLSQLETSGKFPSHSCVPDVIVLCEAFDKKAAASLKRELRESMGYVFESKIVGTSSFFRDFKFLNGGVTIVSRYPIVYQRPLLYEKDASGEELLANKGAIYCRIQIPGGRLCHVIGTHLQAWPNRRATEARQNQISKLRRFIDELEIPSNEPLIVAGDMNTCRAKESSQYRAMLDTLSARDANEGVEEFLKHAQGYLKSGSRSQDPPSAQLMESANAYLEMGRRRNPRGLVERVGSVDGLLGNRIEDEPSISNSTSCSTAVSSGEDGIQRMRTRSSDTIQDCTASQGSDDNSSEAPLEMVAQDALYYSINSLFSMNPQTNPLAVGGISSDDDGQPSIYDFVLFSKNHMNPSFTFVKALYEMKHETPFRVKGKDVADLSDHYPVLAHLRFGDT